MKATYVLAALLPLTAACRSSAEPHAVPPPASQVSSPADVVLVVGQEVRIDSLLRLAFLGVAADSRCATTVICIWQGDGAVQIAYAIGMGPSSPDTLHTALDPRVARFAGYAISLLELMPYPYTTNPIPADEYAARFRIERSRL